MIIGTLSEKIWVYNNSMVSIIGIVSSESQGSIEKFSELEWVRNYIMPCEYKMFNSYFFQLI